MLGNRSVWSFITVSTKPPGVEPTKMSFSNAGKDSARDTNQSPRKDTDRTQDATDHIHGDKAAGRDTQAQSRYSKFSEVGADLKKPQRASEKRTGGAYALALYVL
jgi:hypothetical protein